MAWDNGAGVLLVVQVAMRKYKAAVDAVDVPLQTVLAAGLNALKPGWLTVEYAAWQAAGFPAIP